MIVLVPCLILSVAAIVVLVYLLGFRLGGDSWFAQAHRVRSQAAQAEREFHDLTRTAFVAMAEEAERRRRRPF